MKFISTIILGLQFAGIGIHLWTVYILFQIYGLFGAIIGLIMPGVSQIYLFILSWNISGILLTQFNLILIAYIVSWIVVILITMFFAKFQSQE